MAAIAAAFAPAPAPADEASAGLDEIIVTARKKEERRQDVPLAVTAITSTEVERLNLNSVEDFAKLDASVIFDRGYSQTDNRIVIRGLSPTRGRVNAAVLIDGIDVSAESISFAGGSLLATDRLLDLERVEVVKGPQSALFGRSAFAGAIQYVTKDPTDELFGALNADIGDYGRYQVSGTLSGPVGENFGLRLNTVYWNNDGVYRNVGTGAKVGGGDGYGAALTGKWEPSERFELKSRLEFTDDHYDPSATAAVRHNELRARIAEGAVRLNPQTGLADRWACACIPRRSDYIPSAIPC